MRTVQPLMLALLALLVLAACGRAEDKARSTPPADSAAPAEAADDKKAVETPATKTLPDAIEDAPAKAVKGEEGEKAGDDTAGAAPPSPTVVPTPEKPTGVIDRGTGSQSGSKGAKPNGIEAQKRKPKKAGARKGNPNSGKYREEFGVEGKTPDNEAGGGDKGNYREEFGVE